MDDEKGGVESATPTATRSISTSVRPAMTLAVLLCCALAHAAEPATDKAPQSSNAIWAASSQANSPTWWCSPAIRLRT